MEYGTVIESGEPLRGAQLDNNLLRYPGWYQTKQGCSGGSFSLFGSQPIFTPGQSPYEKLFSNETIDALTASINAQLQGIGPDGQNVMYTPNAVAGELSTVFNTTRVPTGDIYSRYIIDDPDECWNFIQRVLDRTQELMVSVTQNQYGAIRCNNQLSIWPATVLGDFNKLGLRQTPKIKIRERHPEYMQFHMRY